MSLHKKNRNFILLHIFQGDRHESLSGIDLILKDKSKNDKIKIFKVQQFQKQTNINSK